MLVVPQLVNLVNDEYISWIILKIFAFIIPCFRASFQNLVNNWIKVHFCIFRLCWIIISPSKQHLHSFLNLNDSVQYELVLLQLHFLLSRCIIWKALRYILICKVRFDSWRFLVTNNFCLALIALTLVEQYSNIMSLSMMCKHLVGIQSCGREINKNEE